MRLLTLALTLALLVVGIQALAHGDDNDAVDDAAELTKKVDALELQNLKLEKQMAYLLSRERALTAYALRAEERGKGLQLMVRRMRQQGFQNRSIPADSRETLLAGLDEIGHDLLEELPVITREQQAILQAARRIR